MSNTPPRRTGGYSDRPDTDHDAMQPADYDGGLRAPKRVAPRNLVGDAGEPTRTNGAGYGRQPDTRPALTRPAGTERQPERSARQSGRPVGGGTAGTTKKAATGVTTAPGREILA